MSRQTCSIKEQRKWKSQPSTKQMITFQRERLFDLKNIFHFQENTFSFFSMDKFTTACYHLDSKQLTDQYNRCTLSYVLCFKSSSYVHTVNKCNKGKSWLWIWIIIILISKMTRSSNICNSFLDKSCYIVGWKKRYQRKFEINGSAIQ